MSMAKNSLATASRLQTSHKHHSGVVWARDNKKSIMFHNHCVVAFTWWLHSIAFSHGQHRQVFYPNNQISHVCHGIDVCSIDVVEFPIVFRSFQHGVSICLVWMLFSLRVVCNWSAVSFLQPKLQVFQMVTMVSRYPGAFGGAAVGDGDLGGDEGIKV